MVKELPTNDEKILKLSSSQLQKLEQRIQESSLNSSDIITLLSILKIYSKLKVLLTYKKAIISKLLRKAFGLKSEKTQKAKSNEKPKNATPTNEKSGRNGRNGRDDYPGAKKEKINHLTLKPGNSCPECLSGSLVQEEPNVDYLWEGGSPLKLTIYLLQKLICHNCKTSFVADSPAKKCQDLVDDKKDSYKTARCDKNATANATIASLRFEYGIPHYRLAKLQGRKGLGLPVATQDKMLKQVFYSALPIYRELIKQAANGELFLIDDTNMKVLDLIKSPKDPPTGKKIRKSTRTSVILGKLEEKTIVLHFTGHEQAGENLSKILDHRSEKLESPLKMSDALAANNTSHETISGMCLDHGRRYFFDLKALFPKEANFVLDEIAKIYLADREAKEKKLSEKERQLFHSKKSGPVLIKIGNWIKKSLSTGEVEENSELGKAMKYWLNHWSELTEFIHTPGMPLSNAETERVVKNTITHRKNSLFYKTEVGALAGDVIQSIIETCNKLNVNSFDYQVALQTNRSKVISQPENWLPWNFQKNFS